MNCFPLCVGVVLEQRLAVLPAREAADLDHANVAAKVNVDDIVEIVTRAFAEDGAFHMSWLELAAVHGNMTLRGNDDLGDVEAVCISAL